MKAGKLAKPRVAMATPAVFTAMKKLTQWPARSRPQSARRSHCAGPRARQAWPARRAKRPRASTANSARPNTITPGEALASLPNTPVRPKRRAPPCRAARAERRFMGILQARRAPLGRGLSKPARTTLSSLS
ncbi:Uncharacterised protein [Acinetobacter baumannii]|nr:Uncharacterised protein [Acinetobacter baumannii]